jgi:hypothetical protein
MWRNEMSEGGGRRVRMCVFPRASLVDSTLLFPSHAQHPQRQGQQAQFPQNNERLLEAYQIEETTRQFGLGDRVRPTAASRAAAPVWWLGKKEMPSQMHQDEDFGCRICLPSP